MFLYISSLQIFYGFFDKYSKCVFPSGEDISVIKIRWRGNLPNSGTMESKRKKVW